MILEIKQWPESQEVMDDPEWFFISSNSEKVGDTAYARIVDKEDIMDIPHTRDCPECMLLFGHDLRKNE